MMATIITHKQRTKAPAPQRLQLIALEAMEQLLSLRTAIATCQQQRQHSQRPRTRTRKQIGLLAIM